MNNVWLLVLALPLATGLACGTGCRPASDATGRDAAPSQLVSVEVFEVTQAATPRTTTQPATVHAYYEARIFAKAAGYLSELKVDIGTSVKKGDLLAVIGVPEMAKQREAKLATIRRMEADQSRAE